MHEGVNLFIEDETQPFEGGEMVAESEIPEYMRKLIEEEHKVQQAEQAERAVLKAKMQLKVFQAEGAVVQKGEVKVVFLFRDQSYQDLFALACEAFGISEEARAACRLRKYNVPNDLYLDAYDGREEESMEKLGINPYSSLAFEWRGASGEFEKWEAHMMVVKLNMWRPGI